MGLRLGLGLGLGLGTGRAGVGVHPIDHQPVKTVTVNEVFVSWEWQGINSEI
jgi:hypothetical protein